MNDANKNETYSTPKGLVTSQGKSMEGISTPIPDPDPDVTSTAVEAQREMSTTTVEKRREMIVFCAICWLLFLLGWNNATIGPLLPRLQQTYNVRNQIHIAHWA
jgi:hypothetical protein